MKKVQNAIVSFAPIHHNSMGSLYVIEFCRIRESIRAGHFLPEGLETFPEI